MGKTGIVEWMDLTVDDAENVRKFYQDVAGWKAESFDMGEYFDYNMLDADGNIVAGICHARGGNAGIPPMWIPYISVKSLDQGLKILEENGGKLLNGPRIMPQGKYAIVQDPAGACCALWEKQD